MLADSAQLLIASPFSVFGKAEAKGGDSKGCDQGIRRTPSYQGPKKGEIKTSIFIWGILKKNTERKECQ